jgi:iron complex transport system ATP-binding protein
MMTLNDVGHWYRDGRWLFRHLSFDLQAGRITAILGPNGSGKTTLLRAICRTLVLREGEIRGAAAIGYVPQAQLSDSAYRVLDMVLLGRSRYLGHFSAPRRSDVAQAWACLREVGLSDIAEHRYDRLSGGQRQLVLLARALATDCDVLVLDEPASALDLANQGVVLRLLQRLAAARGLAVVFTTHHPDHALAIADTALLLMDETTSAFGTIDAAVTDENLARMYGIPVRRVAVLADHERIETIVPIHGLQRDASAPS